jgi:hypothetical protein
MLLYKLLGQLIASVVLAYALLLLASSPGWWPGR